MFYAKIYETKRTNETFRKLKSILVASTEMFLNYVISMELSEYIKDLRMHFTDEVEPIVTQGLIRNYPPLTLRNQTNRRVPRAAIKTKNDLLRPTNNYKFTIRLRPGFGKFILKILQRKRRG